MEFWRSEDYLLEGASGGSEDPITLLPFCGTEELRTACLQWQGEGPDPWMELRRVQHEFLEGKIRALIQKLPRPRQRAGRVLVPVREADPAHRLDSTKPGIQGPVMQAVYGLDHVEDHGRQCQEAPAPDLTTTSHPEPSRQGDTALSPTNNTQGRTLKRLTTNFRTSTVSRCRSPRRVLVRVQEAEPCHRLELQDTKPELEPVPAAQDEDDLEVLEGCEEQRETAPKRKRGWLQHLLSCFRWTARKSRKGDL
ncbi:uncharacterized protein LOC111194621 [Astyanax mexicanus]|uniref:uncharacterized protein LOC111194621 n=1 Tax=Astyanax mexicanus TaxID=7994 RepID=UPI0020CAF428|nr:uncharacterized protein LOC111194621 [Astyanax mexicanus]